LRFRKNLLLYLGLFFIFGQGCILAVSGGVFGQWGADLLVRIESELRLSGSLYAESLTDRFPSYAWGQGVMFRALAAASKVDSSYLQTVQNMASEFHSRYRCYYNGRWAYNASANNCGDRYYDDNAWIALGYMELYEITGSSTYLSRAQELVAFCMSGENSPTDTPNGGIRWHESNTSGASVCSTAPTCLANLMIYQATGTEQYLTDAVRLYNWLSTSDLRYASGIYHEANQGPLGYQTAVVLQAAVYLYRITCQAGYLAEAQRLAAAMEHEFINKGTHALNQTGKWGGHDMTNAYADLYQTDHNRHWLNIASGYLEFLYKHCRDAASGRYPVSWNNTSGSPSAYLIDNASAAMAIWRMAGTLGGSEPAYVTVKNRSSSRCFRLYNSSTADNTNLVIYDRQPTDASELFTLTDAGEGYYILRSWSSNKVLQLYSGLTADNTPIVIYPANALQHVQQWSLIPAGSGYYNIQNRLTGKSLQPYNLGTVNNTSIVAYTTNPTLSAQHWQFENLAVPTSITLYFSINGGSWIQSQRAILNVGETASLKADAPGAGVWRWDGPKGYTASGNEITLEHIQAGQAGLYCAVYTNDSGAESYAAFALGIHAPVTLYQHCSYGGWQAKLGLGAYTLADLTAAGVLNNDASSVKVAEGYRVTFYDSDNFQGPSLVKTADDSCFVDDGWNDRITSLIIEGQPAPTAYWAFDDRAGLTVRDSSSNGFHGQMTNMDQTSWTMGKRCGGLNFDGIDDYVAVPGFTGIKSGQSRTCAAWIKTTQAGGDIISWGTTAPGCKWIVRLNETGGLRTEVAGGYIYGRKRIDDGQWHHIAVVLENDGTADIAEAVLFVDGQPDMPAAAVYCPVNTADSVPAAIGLYPTVGIRPFKGLIDEVRIYNRALSNTDVRHLYTASVLAGDIVPDGKVNLADVQRFAEQWLLAGDAASDTNCDGLTDLADFPYLAAEWLTEQ